VLYPKIPFESSSFFLESSIANLFSDKASPRVPISNYFIPNKFLFFSNLGIKTLKSENLTRYMLSNLNFLRGKKFDNLLIGPGSGALAHISSSLNTFFLPTHTTFVKASLRTLRVDDANSYIKSCSKIAKKVLSNNSDVDIVLHYDPIHDRALLKHWLVFRIKYLSLNKVHKRIINHFLKKEGVLFYFENKQPWPWHRINEHVWFQLGGYGGLSFEEYQGVSERLVPWVDGVSWRLTPNKSLMYDSEWGSSKEFGDSIREFCNEHGYSFVRIKSEHIMDLSFFAALVFYEMYKPRVNGFLIENFWAHSATAAQLSRLVPYWIPWPDCFSMLKARKHLEKLLSLSIPKTARIGRYCATGPDIMNVKHWEGFFKLLFDKVEFYGAVEDVGFKGISAVKHLIADLFSIPNFVDHIYKLSKIINDKSSRTLDLRAFLKIARKSGLVVKHR